MMIFTLRSKKYDIIKRDVEVILEKLEPEPLRSTAKYYIEYEGKRYPIKQVASSMTGLYKIQFTSRDAYEILTKLGFEVKELREAT
jgi:hypothetical protein